MLNRNRKKEKRSKLALMILLSVVVFIIITVAMLMTYLILFILSRAGVIGMGSGDWGLLEIMEFVFCSSLIIGLILTNSMGSAIILRPVYRVIRQLNRLAAGDFSARLHIGKPIGDYPTFKEVENSFNRAAEELEHTEMLRSDFINNFSHEFKTPIVSIAGFARLLRKGNLSKEKTAEYLEVIEEESLRLADMANNVMTLTRVENLTILTNVTKINVSEEIRSSVLLLEKKWSQKNLEMDMADGEYTIEANEELLRHVWINLLDNAIKFSDEGGRITIAVKEQDASLSISISNTCPDIPQEKLAHIFNKFYQADESHSSQGNGIGLAVVKKICDLHGGKTDVISKGGTTTFTVHLPREQN